VENRKTFPLTVKKKNWKKGMSNIRQGRNGRRVDMDPHEGGSGTSAGSRGNLCSAQSSVALDSATSIPTTTYALAQGRWRCSARTWRCSALARGRLRDALARWGRGGHDASDPGRRWHVGCRLGFLQGVWEQCVEVAQFAGLARKRGDGASIRTWEGRRGVLPAVSSQGPNVTTEI
jgi:hypothetical protein